MNRFGEAVPCVYKNKAHSITQLLLLLGTLYTYFLNSVCDTSTHKS